jgi:hypothetical protein
MKLEGTNMRDGLPALRPTHDFCLLIAREETILKEQNR